MNVAAILLMICLVGCSGSQRPRDIDRHAELWNDLRALCGKAFAGQIAVDRGGGGAPDPFAGKILLMHVRDCSDREIRVPFHVGDDRSRTWVFTRIPGGVRLKHDHRHADGTSDALTMYGGDSTDPVGPDGHKFPADAFSREMFTREKRLASVPNVWVVALVRGQRYSYALTRPGREFRVDFDLTRPVAAPPPPWGTAP